MRTKKKPKKTIVERIQALKDGGSLILANGEHEGSVRTMASSENKIYRLLTKDIEATPYKVKREGEKLIVTYNANS